MAKVTSAFDAYDEDRKVIVKLPSPTGKGEDEYEVNVPTQEQLILFASSVASPTTAPAAVMEIIEDIFDPMDYALIRQRLRLRGNDPARLRFDDVSEVITAVMEEVGDFPTQQPSGSSRSRTNTGGRSTGRVHSTVSTLPASVSDAS